MLKSWVVVEESPNILHIQPGLHTSSLILLLIHFRVWVLTLLLRLLQGNEAFYVLSEWYWSIKMTAGMSMLQLLKLPQFDHN